MLYVHCPYLVAQSCLTLCDLMDFSLPGSSVHGILQARIHSLLQWDLPDPGIKHGSPASQADSLLSEVYLYKISNSFFVTVELEFLVKWILVSEGVED